MAVKSASNNEALRHHQLLNEKTILESLAGNNSVVQLISSFFGDGWAYLILEKARVSLDKIDKFDAYQSFIKVYEGLEFMHNKAIIHRDIKPANLLVTEDSRVILCDFGLAGPILVSPIKTKAMLGTKKFASQRVMELFQNTIFDDLESFVYTIIDIISRPTISTYSTLKLDVDLYPGELLTGISYVRGPVADLTASTVNRLKAQISIFCERCSASALQL